MKPLHENATDMTFDAVVELTLRNKRELVSLWKPGTDERELDLDTQVVVVRDGHNHSVITAGPTGPMAARRAGHIAASLMRPTELFVVGDTVGKFDPDFPDEEIRAGQMVEAWNAGDREGLRECLMMQRYDRSGIIEARFYPYVRFGALVTWKEPRIVPDPTTDGMISEYVKEGWVAGDKAWGTMGPLAHLAANLMQLPVDEREMHIDRACAKHASELDHGTVVILEPYAMWVDGQEMKG